MPDFVELDDPEVVVSELPDPVAPDGLPLVPLPLVEPLVLGDGLGRVVPGDPLIPLDPEPDRVVVDEELPASRPSVVSRSEQAPRPSAATAAATATPIARVFICFIFTPDFNAEGFTRTEVPGFPCAPLWPSGRP